MGESDRSVSKDYTVPQLGKSITAVVENPREWFFLLENRLVVAGGLLVVSLVLFLGLETVIGIPEHSRAPLLYMLGALIGGNLTLVTIVISINQLVVSQQLETPGGLREQIRGVNEYREAVEDSLPSAVPPVTPSDFLELLLSGAQQTVESLREQLDSVSDDAVRAELTDLADDLMTNVTHTRNLLERSDIGVFNALAVTLKTNYSEEIYRIRTLQVEHEPALSEDIDETLEDLVVRIQQIDVARQYFKNLYLQDELARLSRMLLYVGVVAEAALLTQLLVFAASSPQEVLLSPSQLSVVVPVVITVAAAPLAVLFAFVLRISVVAQRTAAITPFTTSQADATEPEGVEDLLEPEQ